MARFEPLKPNEFSLDLKKLYEEVRGSRTVLGGPFSVLLHNPPLAAAIQQVVNAVRRDGKLEKRLYELIVLIVARHASAAYAWAVHDPLARQAGLSGEVIDAIQAKRKPVFAKDDERIIYDAVTELVTTSRIGDAAYQALIKQFGLKEAIEVITCVGLYGMVGAVINTFEVPTPNGEKPF